MKRRSAVGESLVMRQTPPHKSGFLCSSNPGHGKQKKMRMASLGRKLYLTLFFSQELVFYKVKVYQKKKIGWELGLPDSLGP